MPKTGKIKDKDSQVYIGCGNVFEDLGLPNADILLLKAVLTSRMEEIIKERNLRKKDAAAILGVDPAEVSNVLNERFHKYSLERLFKFLLALGEDIEVATRPKSKGREKGELIHEFAVAAKQAAEAARAAHAAPEKQAAVSPGAARPKLQPKRKTKTAAKTKKRAAPKRKAA